jgi:heptaprenyl diphosphate synthase
LRVIPRLRDTRIVLSNTDRIRILEDPKLQIGLNNSDNFRLIHLAFFTALAISIYVLENLLPRPFPFMKIGLSNVVVLILLIKWNFRSALVVAVTKTFIGGFFSGTILSPTTLFSFGGSLAALFIMLVFIRTKIAFSVIGISIAGAVVHNVTQLLIVRSILIKENSIFYLTPLMILMGIVTGVITGYLAKMFMDRFKKKI